MDGSSVASASHARTRTAIHATSPAAGHAVSHLPSPTGKIFRRICEPRTTAAAMPGLDHGDYPDLSRVPPCYHDLREVFSKSKATSLPPHRHWDCAIDLLPGAPIPKARLHSILGPERKAMDEYIEASLRSGIIRPLSSPAGAGFFFVGKKDSSLRPCIDYSALNDITVKNRYPLPLISSAFELLQQARVFTKLDMQNTYHLVRIREGEEWKTSFNTPTGHYEYLVTRA